MAEDIGFSEDRLLGGRIVFRQPTQGYRAAVDPILLAAAVPVQGAERVLDVGAGAGAAALCLAARAPEARVTGIEVQRPLVRLAQENIALNGFGGRVEVMLGDLLNPPPRLPPGSFDHVMANPPYLEEARADLPPDAGKATANVEGQARLDDWIRFCLTMLRPKGSLTVIHRADRLDAVLMALSGRTGEIVVFPLWPMGADSERPAKRIIVRARKGVATPLRLSPGLILHQPDGAFTPQAETILRDGAVLIL